MKPWSEINQEQKVWASPDSVAFYQTHRHKPEQLYPSEEFFLPDVLKEVATCLDIGCAAGGFSCIMKSFNPNLRYVGVDIIPQLIELARITYPDSEFYVGDGINLPFAPDSFELIYSSGVLHLNSHYQEIVRSAYRLCSKYLLCDFRLTEGTTLIAEFDVNFDGKSIPEHPLPYIVVNVKEVTDFLRSLRPTPASIQAKGYAHAPSPTGRIPLKEVIMAFFLIRKGNEHNKYTSIELDFSYPPRQGKGVKQ